MYNIGVDIGGTTIAVGLVDDNGTIIRETSVLTNTANGPQELIKGIVELCFKIINEQKVSIDQIKSIGIGIPGQPDMENGKIAYVANLKTNGESWKNVPIREIMQKYIDLPIFVGNDAKCAAIAEYYFGAAKGISNAVLMTLGTGVGGGIVIGGKIYMGKNGLAGEIGHTIIHKEGDICGCGQKGCLEVYASARALANAANNAAIEHPESILNEMLKRNNGKIDCKVVFEALETDDIVTKNIFDSFCDNVAIGIVNIINQFQPDAIILGGGVSAAGNKLLDPIKNKVKQRVFAGVLDTNIVLAKMNNGAGIIGAAFLEGETDHKIVEKEINKYLKLAQ